MEHDEDLIDPDLIIDSMVAALRANGHHAEADEAQEPREYGEDNASVIVCADYMLRYHIRPDEDSLKEYGKFAQDYYDNYHDDSLLDVYASLMKL